MTRTNITIHTRDVPPAVLHDYCHSIPYGAFVREIRAHYDPLYKLPRRRKDGLALYIVDDEKSWLLIYADSQKNALFKAGKWANGSTVPDVVAVVDRELIDITPPNRNAL